MSALKLQKLRLLPPLAQNPLPQSSGKQSFPPGRLVEVIGHEADAKSSFALNAVLQAQSEHDVAAWVQFHDGGLYPPDLYDSGVDLGALLIAHIPRQYGNNGILKASEMLLRSGSLGTLVLELQKQSTDLQVASARLLALAKKHQSRVVILSESTEQSSLGSLVALRMQAQRRRCHKGQFLLEASVQKNKVGFLPPLQHRFRAPWGVY